MPSPTRATRIPRDDTDDHSEAAAATRRAFVAEQTGTSLTHVGSYSLDPAGLAGNIENFVGVAQVPIGLAGPLSFDGEHARGDVVVPMATTEGAMVAGYSRGMRVLNACGGVRTTVVDEAMQRAPVFTFANARDAHEFGAWLTEHFDAIKAAAESTTRTGRLLRIDQFPIGPLRYLRFDYTCGDAAGQNMTGKATFVACEWIKANHPDHPDYLLSGNMDTDKKHSQANMLLTRGRRVVAEATLRRDVLREMTGVDTRTLFQARQVSTTGAFLAGAAANGTHAANGIAALFLATGQDVANVAESHAAITYSQLLDDGNYYWSVTLPSLIVATYGGGTGLPTQRECLEMLGCCGAGKVRRLAEICAGVVLAGEVSLSCAILAGDWVASHDALGRNRP